MAISLDFPDDILERIFQYFCLCDADSRDWDPHGEWNVSNINDPPVFERPPQHILSGVCSHWYYAVRAFTSLWESISVVFNKRTSNAQWTLIEHAVLEGLVKSRDAPLTLRIIDTGFPSSRKPRPQLMHVFKSLLECSSRWKSFRLQTRNPTLLHAAAFPTRLDLGILEELRIIQSVMYEMPQAFKHVPNLIRVTAVNITNLNLPWHQIKEITIQNERPEIVCNVIHKCLTSPVLERIHCHGLYTPPAGHLVKLIHPSAHDVRLPASNWLVQASLPSLQELFCDFSYDDEDLTVLLSFLERSPCTLRSLTFKRFEMSPIPIRALSPYVLALRELHLRIGTPEPEAFIAGVLGPLRDADVLAALETLTVSLQFFRVFDIGHMHDDEHWVSVMLRAYTRIVNARPRLSLLHLKLYEDQDEWIETRAFQELKNCEARGGFRLETRNRARLSPKR
ncbi:hypothetical protein CYLTODRAFT_492245 [Cylindrobasidium torrendii FP15055 ss-10]|uniref:F-box domain-containing protein n=1 Tax=Cylindrobasidium torrendii FP15055 ss-10 TaxID=1314674 RepID=A0A0D7B4W0_9AGAR|nr:hypothetical protein CYLTODRAFT_492245 [Cylindrobasidium torrendii FP15055 ss-10]